MKLSKTEFKKILKQCIKELITEGAFDNAIKENVNYAHPARIASNDFVNDPQQPQQQNSPQQNFNPFASVGQSSPNERMRELVKMTAFNSAKGDQKQAAMMESIFADTAEHTYTKQRSAEGGGGMVGNSHVSKEDEQYDKAQLDVLSGGFGSNHWASLAFGKYEKK